MRLTPFRAIRPRPELAAQVASVPYDVVNRAEAAELARGNPHSFLHVGRSDIDLPEDVDQYDPRIYSRARQALDELIAGGTLMRDPAPRLFLYRQVMDGRTQTGVVGCVHVDDYERDLIRKHEKTRQDKEDDRTRHVLTLNANAEPVFLTYRGRREIDAAVDRIATSTDAALRFHRARRRPPHGVAGARLGPAGGRLRRGPLFLRSGRAPPVGQRLAGGEGAAGEESGAPGRGGVQLVPRGPLPGRPASDPAVQPGGARPERAGPGGGAGPPARTGAADGDEGPQARPPGRLLRLSRRPLAPAGAGPFEHRPHGSDRLARRVAAPGPGPGADPGHRRSRGRTSGSTSWAASAARRSWSGG